MANPYSNPVITGYNQDPPNDDGSNTSSNEITWAKHKDKIGDPLKTFATTISNNVNTAVAKMVGGAGVTKTSIDYTVQLTDQGNFVTATAGGITITTPDAGSVGTPFVFSISNGGDSTITVDGNDDQTIDGETSLQLPVGRGLALNTDGSNWFTQGRNFEAATPVPRPQGYLSLTSGSPVSGSDQTAQTSIYYTQDKGDTIPIWNGSRLVPYTFSEMTLSLVAAHSSNGVYDVFLWLESGVLTIGTGPVWTTITAGSGARGSGAGTSELTRKGGIYVNNVEMTARNGSTTYTVAENLATYVGTIHVDGTAGQISCHRTSGQSRKWGVWNAYNRRAVSLQATDPNLAWTYDQAVIRSSNGSASNSVTVLSGLAEEACDVRFTQVFGRTNSNGAMIASIGIGLDSTAVYSGQVARYRQTPNPAANAGTRVSTRTGSAHLIAPPKLGVQIITALENNDTPAVGAVPQFYGQEEMRLVARFMA